MYYLETGSHDPAYNLAFEEYVLTHCRNGSFLILWQNANSVIIGRNQNAAAEINNAFVSQNGIRVVRRNTGGGAVYHDLGNLNYSFIADATDPVQRNASAFTTPVVRALRSMGLDAEASGRNDILVSGRKVSGTAQQLKNGRILHHGTLLFDTNVDMLSGSLNPDPTKFQFKGVQSVRSRVGSIRNALPADMTLMDFWSQIKRELSEDGCVPYQLPADAQGEILALKANKYDTWEWNYGKSPQYQTCYTRRWSGGLLELQLSVANGNISALQIFGDFLALTDVAPLENALLGQLYREDAIKKVLQALPISEYLGSITATEFITTLFDKEEAS